MTGRQARIVGPPEQRQIVERVDEAVGKWPRPPNHSLDGGGERAWHRNRGEQKGKPRRGRPNDQKCEARQRRGRERCDQCQAKPDRKQEPPRLAKIGHFLEGGDDPPWQVEHRFDRPGVNEDHQPEDHDQ